MNAAKLEKTIAPSASRSRGRHFVRQIAARSADRIPICASGAGFAHRDQPFRVIMTGRSGSS